MRKRFPLLNRDWVQARLYHLLAPLVALLFMAGFVRNYIGQLVEAQTVNLRFQLRAHFDPPADSRLVFVGIDHQSLDKLGRYPWPRTVIATFLTNLAKCDQTPHTVAFDIFYTEKTPEPGVDDALGDAAGSLASVVTASLCDEPIGDSNSIRSAMERTKNQLKDPGPTSPFTSIHGDPMKIRGSDIAELPVDPLRKQSYFGFANDDPSPVDGIRHTIPLLIRIHDRIYPSLALQILCQTLHVDADKVVVNVGENVVLKNDTGKLWTIPMNIRGEYTINYRSNRSFEKNCLSFGLLDQALKEYGPGKPLPADFTIQNKILVIGETDTGMTDLGPTPVAASSPLPYTHLNVINNVLTNDYLHFVPGYIVVLGWALFTWPTLLRLKEAPLGEAILVPTGVIVFYVIFSCAIFLIWSWQIDLAWPVISYTALNFGGVVLRWQEERMSREQLKQLFSRMISPEFLTHMLAHPENVKMGGSERAVTVLFSDIRDYTKFSEGLSSPEVVRQLNVYFERMVPCVQRSRGTFHKYIGDAIMAAWGDIEVTSQGPEMDARNGVHAALMMRRALRQLNHERQAAGLIPLRIGTGLNHGSDVTVGLIGASSRIEFTVMGDAVNVASRLEGLTKTFHTDLAISESVRQLIGEAFLVRRLGLIVLTGKSTPTVVYEVLAEKTEMGESRIREEAVARYERAFDFLLARQFADAAAGFEAFLKDYPRDYCGREYLEASRAYTINPPPPDWDGRIVMTTK